MKVPLIDTIEPQEENNTGSIVFWKRVYREFFQNG